MKFQCSSCGLRLNSLHFKVQGLINPKLTSICDLCRQRGLVPEDYGNPVVKIFAKTSFSPLRAIMKTSIATVFNS